MQHVFVLIVLIALLSVPLRATSPEDEVRDRTGADVRWQRDQAARQEAADAVRRLLKKPLTIRSAVQIALLNNRNLQATFEEIGIARADLMDAVTAPNPSLSFDFDSPLSGGVVTGYAAVIAQELVQILTLPLKKRIAIEQLEAAQLRVASEVLQVVAEVKKAYFTVQANQQLLSRLKIIQETASTSLDLNQRQYEAGNITDLTLLQAQASYSEGRLEIAQASMALGEHREQLNRLLGLWGDQTNWKITGDVLPVPVNDFLIRNLEALAVSQRLDLQAAHRDLLAATTALKLNKSTRWVPALDLGFNVSRDIDGARSFGPSLGAELPVFNRGKGRVSRNEAELRRAAVKLEALAVDIRSEVREKRDKLLSLRDIAKFYHDDLLPTRIKVVNKALLEYNAMQLSAYQLFMVKADELKAERGYIDTSLEYWSTRADLERIVGGTLNPRKPAISEPQK
ncbi:MAG TPA: TolC family protein [Chthoniobacterales bacterium]